MLPRAWFPPPLEVREACSRSLPNTDMYLPHPRKTEARAVRPVAASTIDWDSQDVDADQIPLPSHSAGCGSWHEPSSLSVLEAVGQDSVQPDLLRQTRTRRDRARSPHPDTTALGATPAAGPTHRC